MSQTAVLQILYVAAGVITVIGATVGVTLYLSRFQARIGENRLKEETEELRRLNSEMEGKLEMMRSFLIEAKLAGAESLVLKSEIDEALTAAKLMLNAKAASVLVPYPLSDRNELVFLSIDSPSALKLRKTRLPNNPDDPGIAVKVFHQGKPHIASDVDKDLSFNPNVDKRSESGQKTSWHFH